MFNETLLGEENKKMKAIRFKTGKNKGALKELHLQMSKNPYGRYTCFSIASGHTGNIGEVGEIKVPNFLHIKEIRLTFKY